VHQKFLEISILIREKERKITHHYLANIWSSHVRRKFLKIPTLIREKKKEKLTTTAIMKKLD
jgi:hypothetical protein